MKNNRYKSAITLVSTGLAGLTAGILINNYPVSFAANRMDGVMERTATESSKSFTADKLSKDFITVSKDVTPAIVTINSTKIIKQQVNPEYLNDPFFQRFFGPQGGQNPESQEGKQQGLGSGVIVDKSGIILTNNHVVEGADDIHVTLSDKRKYKAKIIGTDPKTDVAVIKLEKAVDLPVARLGDSSKLSVGEWVLAIGNPLGLSSTVTSGIISAKGRADVGVADFEDFIQTDAAINPGNSGGALVNLQGEVIGINTAIASKTGGYMGIGFAIPSNMAHKVMNDLINHGKVTRGYLGIQIQNMTESLAKSLRVDDPNKGIIVGDVVTDSPAAKAGLQRYDVLLRLNETEIADANSFRNAIAATDPGQTAKLLVLRDGRKINVDIKLAELQNTKVASVQQKAKSRNLGFETQSLTPDILNQLGLSEDISGVIVSGIDQNSNAAEAGLNSGDIIQEINRNKINSPEDFSKISSAIRAGDSVLLKVIRGKNVMLLAFTVQ